MLSSGWLYRKSDVGIRYFHIKIALSHIITEVVTHKRTRREHLEIVVFLCASTPLSQYLVETQPAAYACTTKEDPFPTPRHVYLNLLASRSDSSRQRMSSSRTITIRQHSPSSNSVCYRAPRYLGREFVPGPLTLRIMLRVVSSMNSTLT